ncbi:MAG: NAD(P)/FAD-dependent oxidoreductase [Candidatus Aminicenantes bacterium]|nr:MAG: NAD(P)/FAD-dependent oxidoreductase [Candidatus Aminicenantes bacterium]
MQYDVIIIGSGLGGLAAGAKLAKEGKKVLLLEQHFQVGGCATHFKRKDYTFEVSLHELNGLNKTDHIYKMYQNLDAVENLTFLKIPEFYRWLGHGMDIVVPDNAEQAKDILIDKFPDEKKGIQKYLASLFSIRDQLFRMPEDRKKEKLLRPLFPILYPKVVFNMKKSVGEFLDSMIEDDKLKLILLGNLLYYHDDPYTMSLLFYSVAQTSFLSGSYYIQGGSYKLSDFLADKITSNGGEVLNRQLATKIITENGKAIGVEYRQNTKKESETQKAYAKYIISNAAVPNVVNELLPQEEGHKIRGKIESLQYAPSLFNVYIGFKTSLDRYGVQHYSTVVCDESCKTSADIYQNYTGDFTKRNFIFVDYGQIDSKLAPEGKSVGSICTSDYLSDWEHLGREEYRSKKKEVAESFIQRLNDVYPGIKEAVDYYEIGTAKTIQRYTLNPGGSVYGFSQIPSQSGNKRIPHEASIENFYFASAWTQPGGGFGAALGSGYLVANKILKKEQG